MPVSRSSEIASSSACGVAPPASPVSPPWITTRCLARWHSRRIAATSSVDAGRSTARGVRAFSWLKSTLCRRSMSAPAITAAGPSFVRSASRMSFAIAREYTGAPMADSEQPPAPSAAERGGAARWTCPTCGAAAGTGYCGACGERRLSARDLGVLALLGQVFESITNVDGRAFRTFRALFLQPGELTLAFLEGRRKQYIAPFQVFVIANVAFFSLQSLPASRC